jgi:hypothetical protein
MCPRTWQAQYELTKNTVPQSVWKLLDALDKIKKAFPTDQEQPSKKGHTNPSNSNKWKMVSFNDPIPKKSCQDANHCILCKKHRSVHVTHNMSNCCKYEKDGACKKGLRRGQCNSTASNKKTISTYAQPFMKIVKIKKVSKKLKKSTKKCKHEYDSESNDSNSS